MNKDEVYQLEQEKIRIQKQEEKEAKIKSKTNNIISIAKKEKILEE